VAPDYVLAHREIEAELILQMGKAIRAFYGMDPRRSPDYGRIINDRHFQRLTRLLESGEIACGGETDASERYIAPTILRGVTIETPVMQEEIFGPILPVLSVADMDEAIHFVSELPPPLVLYLFSTNRAVQEAVVERTTTGSVCVNDVVLQMAIQDFPFGGVGASGMGHYHGRWSFETFTRPRGVFTRSQRFELPLRYPPHSDAKSRWIARLT
jgi:aldehyde dehydrogenase (NAD+)